MCDAYHSKRAVMARCRVHEMAALSWLEVCDLLVMLVCLCRCDASQLTQPRRSYSSYPPRAPWQKREEMKGQYTDWVRQLKGCVWFSVSFSNPGSQLFDSLKTWAVLAVVKGVTLRSSICLSATLVRPAEAIGQKEIPFGWYMAPSNIVLDQGPSLLWEREIWNLFSPVFTVRGSKGRQLCFCRSFFLCTQNNSRTTARS